LAAAHVALKQFQEAYRSLEQAIALDPGSVQTRMQLGYVLAQLGRHDEAIAQYREVLRQEPANVQTLKYLGNLFARNGRYDEAIDCYQRALQIDPGLEQVRINLEQAQRLDKGGHH
jgi:tetratricopeptide (TPR) repeat protein